jgi:hypothetical protein
MGFAVNAVTTLKAVAPHPFLIMNSVTFAITTPLNELKAVAGKKTAVVVVTPGAVLTDWRGDVAAVLTSFLPGEGHGARVLWMECLMTTTCWLEGSSMRPVERFVSMAHLSNTRGLTNRRCWDTGYSNTLKVR